MAQVLKVIEVLSESPKSFEDAVSAAVAQTAKSVRNIESAYVREQYVTVKDGVVDKYRVNVKITFMVDTSVPDNNWIAG
ncbi:dodecin family protein [Neolewinella litorea]|uniref:Dodecin domain-containing protein n=1 Tax=Neolewinella litorea TaxID=2562452 RepID=A0A4V3XLC8_9BACT|nr:dodecin family protein [Neolewinella litorea]THH40333.1 dodecin domain-containing protein [Neolewinella litorea]